MASETFPFEILTPDHRFFSGEIEALTFTAAEDLAHPPHDEADEHQQDHHHHGDARQK